MTMVFSFMLLVASGSPRNTVSGQTAPDRRDLSGRSTLTTVSAEKIGRLVKENSQLLLVYGNEKYRPHSDIQKLERDEHIALVKDDRGEEKKVLYIEEDHSNAVLLSEYLSAFQYLSRQGIGVAFAKRVK